MSFPYHMSNDTLTVFIDGKTYQTQRATSNWEEIKAELFSENPNAENLILLMRPIVAIEHAVDEYNSTDHEEYHEISVRDGAVYFGTEQISTALSARMLDVMTEGIPLDPWIRFAQNVYANPWKQSREELYLFLEKSDLPITSDGHFLAYKMVDANFHDLHTHTFNNSPGMTVILPGGRDAVDPNRNNTCSNGLHFCSKDYLNEGYTPGQHTVIVKINPADVVSIPADYDNAKGRTWRYEVIKEIDHMEAKGRSWGAVSDWQENSHEDDDGPYPEDDTDPEEDDPEYCEVCGGPCRDELSVVDPHYNMVDETSTLPASDCTSPGCPDHAFATSGLATVTPLVEKAKSKRPKNAKEFKKLLKDHKTMRGIARALDVSAGTVQVWKRKLLG